ncbi:DUF302 domain-containing protein [uncultured Microscilla sp.]|uniref:DUF302 domain-containing protein n=1 Tax=uncultured Microscilla sp. TaxID=432653 RepID=UPI0026040E20|nr:DUF302 domain-containing protein [uncultured Microscilla sp.]
MKHINKILLLLSLFLVAAGFEIKHPNTPATGLINKESPYSVQETTARMVKILKKKGLKVFNVINHAEGAKNAGMDLRPTTVIVFGNPKVGTQLMQCDQRVGLALPMKLLVWENKAGKAMMGYTDPIELKEKFDLKDCSGVLGKMQNALDKLTNAALSK